MNIVIAGGTGFIGTHLTEKLRNSGHHVFILTRNTHNKNNQDGITFVKWLDDGDQPEKCLTNIDAFINLAGESLNSGRWTDKRKQQILTSRIQSTKAIISLIEKLENKPNVLINASAVGYYGTSETGIFTEDDQISGDDFLAHVVNEWETEAKKAEDLGVRTILARFGVVLDKNGGALSKMITPYQLFVGGTIGSGQQWLSWIHIEDAVNLLITAIENSYIEGPLNITAPNPVTMKEMGKAISQVLHRPHWLPAPSFALKMILGEMSVLVLKGQKVFPKKAMAHSFSYEYPDLNKALKDLLN